MAVTSQTTFDPDGTGLSSDPHIAHWTVVAEEMAEAVLVLTPDDSITAWNRHFVEWFGLSPSCVAAGTKLESLHRPLADSLAKPAAPADLWNGLPSGPSGTTVWEIARPQRRVLECRRIPLPGRSGAVMLWADVTEKTDLHRALHRAQRMEGIGRLAGGIAHDINNLLTAISGHLSLALQHIEGGNPGEARAMLTTASKAAIGGREIVKQLLGHARKDAGLVQCFDLRDLIADVRGLLKHSISPLVLVELQLPKQLWGVTADRSSIQQVIINLCVNAVDAMKGRANSRLTLSATNVPRAQAHQPGRHRADVDYVKLDVSDNGSGMPPEVLRRIFEPFFTTKPEGEGTGLGLSISREIVEKCGGWIECQSEPGAGTTFSIFLPRGEKIPVPAKPADAPAPPAQPGAGHSSERILVVDDDALVRTVSARLLGGVGYKVFTATDGIEALEWLRTPGNRADLVLLDVSMPRLSGHDTMRQIRQMLPGLPVVMCSGSLSILDPDATPEDAAVPAPEAHISKPYDISELTRTVRSVLDHRHAGAEACVA